MEQGVVQEELYKSGSVHYIDSREVARMVEKEHSNLLKDIRRYIAQMGKVKIDFSEFFRYLQSAGSGIKFFRPISMVLFMPRRKINFF